MKKPSNPKLYAMVVAQAKAKYSSYPNPGASAWVHKKYVQLGGRFIVTTEQSRKLTMAKKKHDKEKDKHKTEEKKDKGKK